MKLKKRKKTSRLRGSRTAGWGFRQKHKGHGNRGGVGMAGTGKRADHKKQKALIMAKKAGAKKGYFGGGGFTSRKTAKKVNNVLNLDDIKNKFGEGKIELKEYKILGRGEGFKAEIIAESASKIALKKMEKAGGKIIIEEKKGKEKDRREKETEKKKEIKKSESKKE
jgi:large subunit ribosomal protein L15